MEFNSIIAKTFEKEGLGKIRVALLDDKPIFNLYDVCFSLGYTKTDGKKLYLRKEKIENICESLEIKGLSLGDRDKIAITKDIDFENTWIEEHHFYNLCLESHAKNAKPFRDWVTREVLPSIRKTGGYDMNSENSFNGKLESLKLEQQGLKFVIELFKPSKASTVKMIRKFNESQGLTTSYLPTSVDEEEGRSLTNLLQKFEINISTVKFNKLLIEKGYVTEENRPSTNNKGFKKYKKLTDLGLRYGKNKTSTYGSEQETVPLYFESKFQELINEVLN